ncbi:MAG: transporter, partial [Phycisphaerales bacterium]|nr:transporter [Phycisphaerales bacterium]
MPRVPATRRLAARRSAAVLLLAAAAAVSGCAVGPDYRRPADGVKPGYAGVRPVGSTDPASQPSRAHDASKPVAQWWTTFNDPQLEKLVERAAADNLT